MGDLTQESSQKRTQGAIDALSEKYPNIKVLAREAADWMQDKAVQVAENWITAYGDQIDGIISNNDEMAVVASDVFKAEGIDDVLFIGLDGQEYGLNGVKDGTLIASVLQDCQGQTEGGLELAATLGAGGTAGEQIVWIPFQLITLDNLDQFMK
jgi:inositol transport system substrate-binding protein